MALGCSSVGVGAAKAAAATPAAAVVRPIVVAHKLYTAAVIVILHGLSQLHQSIDDRHGAQSKLAPCPPVSTTSKNKV